MWKCHPALQHWALKLLRVFLCLLQWYLRTSCSSCLVTERINHFRIDLSKMDNVLKHPILKWHKILVGLLMRMFFIFWKQKHNQYESIYLSDQNQYLKQTNWFPKVPSAFLKCSHSVAKFKLSLCTMWHCGQETARNWRALSGKRKFLCSKAKLRDCEDYRKQRSNKAYGRSEYTMLLCASCILFIVRATNYCIISPMTHFFSLPVVAGGRGRSEFATLSLAIMVR